MESVRHDNIRFRDEADEGEMRLYRNTLIAALIVAVGTFIAACDQSSDKSANSSTLNQPNDEASFVAAKVDAETAYDQAPNDIVRGQIIEQWRRKDSCAAIKSATFSNWTGNVSSILSDGGFIVAIGNGVTLESDVEQGTPVFAAISKLREGDAVTISGTFTSDDPKCAAQVIALPWGDGAIKSPDFKVTFSDVEALGSQ